MSGPGSVSGSGVGGPAATGRLSVSGVLHA